METSVWGPLVGQVPLTDLQFFFRQFAAMQNAGVGMASTMETLSKQTRNGKLSGIVVEMQRAAEQGRPVTYAMQRYPEVFSPMMISMLRAGEEGGFFQNTLNQLADYMDRDLEARHRVKSALTYPMIIMVMSVVTVIVMATFVLPKFVKFFKQFHSKLPAPTRLLMFIADFFKRLFAMLIEAKSAPKNVRFARR